MEIYDMYLKYIPSKPRVLKKKIWLHFTNKTMGPHHYKNFVQTLVDNYPTKMVYLYSG